VSTHLVVGWNLIGYGVPDPDAVTCFRDAADAVDYLTETLADLEEAFPSAAANAATLARTDPAALARDGWWCTVAEVRYWIDPTPAREGCGVCAAADLETAAATDEAPVETP
jgi:hypothetical protein